MAPDGSFGGSEAVLGSNTINQAFPSLCFDGSQYLMVWSAFTNFVPTTTGAIRGQYFDATGNPQGGAFTALSGRASGEGMFSFRGLVYDGTRFVLAATSVGLSGSTTNITRLTGDRFRGISSVKHDCAGH